MRVHDPSIVRTRTQWWVLFTGDPAISGGAIRMSSSRDGRTWVDRGTVTPGIPGWVQAAVPGVVNLWAPDVSRHDGRWYLYYSASTFGSNRSLIGLMTNRTPDPASPDYRWVDEGIVVESVPTDDFNAIDPTLTTDRLGGAWLRFGSFWSGIKMTRVSLPSGKPATTRPPHLDLVDRRVPPNAVRLPTSSGTPGGTTCSPPSTSAAKASTARTGSWWAVPARSSGRTSTATARPSLRAVAARSWMLGGRCAGPAASRSPGTHSPSTTTTRPTPDDRTSASLAWHGGAAGRSRCTCGSPAPNARRLPELLTTLSAG